MNEVGAVIKSSSYALLSYQAPLPAILVAVIFGGSVYAAYRAVINIRKYSREIQANIVSERWICLSDNGE